VILFRQFRQARVIGRDEFGVTGMAQQFGADTWWWVDGQLWPEWLLEWR
jgi:hypothetical protein